MIMIENYSFNFRIAKVIQGFFTVATFISYGLQCFVPVDIIWGNYLSKLFGKSRNILLWEYVVRIVIVLITCKLIVFLNV